MNPRDLKLEFGDLYPVALNEFYAGGGKVPVGTSGANGPVPSAGAISMSNFRGTAGSLLTGSGWKSLSTHVPRQVSICGSVLIDPTDDVQSFDGGFTWLSRPTVMPAGYKYLIGQYAVYLAGTFYLIGRNAVNYYKMISSTDGQTWVESSITISSTTNSGITYCIGKVYGSDVYIILGLGTWVSYDYGKSWSGLSIPFSGASTILYMDGAAAGIAAGSNGLFLQVSYANPSKLMVSPDLSIWTAKNLYDTLGNNLSMVTISKAFMLAGKAFMLTDTHKIIISADGENFIAHDITLPDWNGGSFTLARGSNYMLAVYNSSTNTNLTAISTDGLSWTTVPAVGTLSGGTITSVENYGGYWFVFSTLGVTKYVHE